MSAVVRPAKAAQDIAIEEQKAKQTLYSARLNTELATKAALQAALRWASYTQRLNPALPPDTIAKAARKATEQFATLPPATQREIFSSVALAGGAILVALAGPEAVTVAVGAALLQPALTVWKGFGDFADSKSQQLHAGGQRLLDASREAAERQDLVRISMERARDNPLWKRTMELLLKPEIGISLDDSLQQLVNSDPILGADPTVRMIVSRLRENGRIRVSMEELRDLFKAEMAGLRESVATNRAMLLEISRTQFDLLAYLQDQKTINEKRQRETEIQAIYEKKIAAANASLYILSTFIGFKDPKLATEVQTVGSSTIQIANALNSVSAGGFLNAVIASGNILGAVMNIYGLFGSKGPPPEQMILDEIREVKSMINELRSEMHSRFDRVDYALNLIYTTLTSRLDQIDLQLGLVRGDLNEIRTSLIDAQAELHRLERKVYAFLDAGFRRDLKEALNFALDHETTFGSPMPFEIYKTYENKFLTWAYDVARDELSSPGEGREYTERALINELNSQPLESNLEYINRFFSTRFGLPILASTHIANPRDWFIGAEAYVRLAYENPMHFRRVSTNRLNAIVATGRELKDFTHRLTLTNSPNGLKLNWAVYDALLGFYRAKLSAFLRALGEEELRYQTENGFAIDTWRRWGNKLTSRISVVIVDSTSADARSQSSSQRTLFYPTNFLGLSAPVSLSGSTNHLLVLKNDGTVTEWSIDPRYVPNVPSGISNVTAVSAGDFTNSLTLLADRTVRAWGNAHDFVPPDFTNVAAIAAARSPSYVGHSFALFGNGTVVSWNPWNPSIKPTVLWTNAVAIAAGSGVVTGSRQWLGLALLRDGSVGAWWRNLYRPLSQAGPPTVGPADVSVQNLSGPDQVPADLKNVVSIAAGYDHCVALLGDGTVRSWGNSGSGVPPGLTDVVAIAAGYRTSLALKSDGTVVEWGSGKPPLSLTNVTAIARFQNGWALLVETNSTDTASPQSFPASTLPTRVRDRFADEAEKVLAKLNSVSDLRSAAEELSGAKALLSSVLELGLSETLEGDDLLHVFLYGNEGLADTSVLQRIFSDEIEKFKTLTTPRPILLRDVLSARSDAFAARLRSRLEEVATTQRAQVPRMVEHTLRLLELLRHMQLNVPAPVFELSRQDGVPRFVIFGEPHVRYALQQSSDLKQWTIDSNQGTVTHESQHTLPISASPFRFYRVLLSP